MKLPCAGSPCVLELLVLIVGIVAPISRAELPTRKYLNVAAIKTMVAGAEAEAQRLHVEVTICLVDESGNLLFLQKADAAAINTIQWAQKKARHAAFYRMPTKDGADTLKKGNLDVLAFPDYFPNQGGLPIQVDGQIIRVARSLKSTRLSRKRGSTLFSERSSPVAEIFGNLLLASENTNSRRPAIVFHEVP